MSYDISNNLRLFADDTSLYVIVDNDTQAVTNSLVSDLDKICKWSDIWAVDFNPSKTKTLDFSRKNIYLILLCSLVSMVHLYKKLIITSI